MFFVVLHNAAECIYTKKWTQRPLTSATKAAQRQSGASILSNGPDMPGVNKKALSSEDDAKLIFGTVFSLRRMVRSLGGDDDRYGYAVTAANDVLAGTGTDHRRTASCPIVPASTSSSTLKRQRNSSLSCSRILASAT